MDQPYIETMLLADHAEAVNGKLYINGGGFTTVNMADLGAPHTCFLALILRIPWGRTNQRLPFSGWIETIDGDRVEGWGVEGQLESGRPPGTRGQELDVTLVMPVQLQAPHGEAGDLVVCFKFGGEVQKRRVSLQPAMPLPGVPGKP